MGFLLLVVLKNEFAMVSEGGDSYHRFHNLLEYSNCERKFLEVLKMYKLKFWYQYDRHKK